MEFIMENWSVLAAALAAVAVIAAAVIRFLHSSRETQLAKVREWLLWAVAEAERDLGGGTGTLKLRQVYDRFVARFPWLARLVSFERFSALADDALAELREMLSANHAVKVLIEGSVACE